MTPTVSVQEPFAGIVPPDKLTPPAGLLAVPPQVVVAAAAVVVTLVGRVSVTATPVSGTLFVLPSVMVKVLVPPGAIVAGENILVTVGRASTISVAVLLFAPGPPSVEVTFVAVFGREPACAPITVTSTAQLELPPVPNVPPEKVTELEVVATMPPHCGVVALTTVMPAASASVKPTPVRLTVFGLVNRNRMVTFVAMGMLVLVTPEAAVPPPEAASPAVGFV